MDKEQIKEIALANGFKLKKQPDGEMNLNPYVYEFARKLLSHQTEVIAQTINDHWCMTDDGEATKGHVLNSILHNIQGIKDKLDEVQDDWFNRGLPLNVEIHGLDCQAYEPEDAAKNWHYADFVRCVNCHKYGYVELGIESCPSCKCTGCLMDIQESDIKEKDDG